MCVLLVTNVIFVWVCVENKVIFNIGNLERYVMVIMKTGTLNLWM